MDTMSAREVSARQAKAEKMAAVLIAHGATADEAAALPPATRIVTAELAGTRAPSVKTWEVVVDTVRAHWHFAQVTAVARTLSGDLADRINAGALAEPPEAHDEECQECGGHLVDYAPLKASRYTEAEGGRCGRCVVSEYA